MALTAYRPLLADARVRAVLLGTGVSGVSTGLTFAVVLAVQNHHSIATAGLAAGAMTIGDAALIPVRGRLIDTRGQWVLLPLAGVHGVMLCGLAAGAASLPVWTLFVLAALAGMTRAPVYASLRSLWAGVTSDPAELDTAYSLQSVFNEILFVSGPVVVAALAGVISPAGALTAVAVLQVTGVAIFTGSALSRSWRGEPRATGRLGALESPGLRTLMLAAVGTGFLFGTLDVASVAFARSEGSAGLGGLALAALAVGSGVGGLVYGAVTWKASLERRVVILSALVVLGALPIGLASSLPVLGILMFAAGVAVAPWTAAEMGLIDRVAPEGTSTESMTWLIAAIMLGTSAGAVAAGHVAESAGAGWALELAVAGGVVSLLVLLARYRTLQA